LKSSILDIVESNIKGKQFNIIVGLGEEIDQNKKMQEICEKFSKKYKNLILLVGGYEAYPENKKDPTKVNYDLKIEREIGNIILDKGEVEFTIDDTVKPADALKGDKTVKTTEFLEHLYQIARIVYEKTEEIRKTGGIFKIMCYHPERVLISLVFFDVIVELTTSKAIESFIKDKALVKWIKEFSGVRGAISAARFISFLKIILTSLRTDVYDILRISRIALLETSDKLQFLFAPVGIDEATNFEKKKYITNNAALLLTQLGIEPHLSIMSGGRFGDVGRNKNVDKTLKTAELLTKYFEKESPVKYEVSNDQILIENAVKKGNFLLAPDGISGNYIYRTLVYLGAGHAYGALYSSVYFKHKKVLIDTSRVAKEPEIQGSLIQAAGFTKLLENDTKKKK
jgi:predicted methyltransferase MtxX (methanogen marker protein 4)